MSYRLRTLLLLLTFSLLSLAAGQGNALPSPAELTNGWNFVAAPEGYVCGLGDPYGFFVHPGDPEKLTLHFQVGGGCWDAAGCAAGSGFYFDHVDPEALAMPEGIFDTENPQNPLRDYTHVVIPSCNGDVHLGDYTASYGPVEIDGKTIEKYSFEHRGFSNAQRVLDWVYNAYESPDEVVITGASAGSVGSIYHAPYIMDHYKGSSLLQIGDSFAGVFPPEGFTPLATWGVYDNLPDFIPELANLSPDDGTFAVNANALYSATANAFPDSKIAEFATRNDATQRFFWVAQGGSTEEGLSLALLDKFSTLNADLPNFYSFLAGGDAHAVMTSDLFYSIKVGNTSYRDWVADLIAGETVADVACEGSACDEAEGVE
ncbi:pectin acetylesterase-family hydrolase [soil metagenome]